MPSYLPITTCVRFIANPSKRNENHTVTRTLGKMGFVHQQFVDGATELPAPGEHWIVEVLGETSPGRHVGCFLLQPVCKIDSQSIVILLPGMYDEENHDGCLIVTPRQRGPNWMLPLEHKRSISGRNEQHKTNGPYAIIVSC